MAQTRFFEVIKPNHNFEFIGRQNLFIGLSALLILVSIVMLPINHYLRGGALNYSIEFRGGTEMTVEFSKNEETGRIREALAAGGIEKPEVVKLIDQQNAYLLRIPSVSVLSESAAKRLYDAFRARWG